MGKKFPFKKGECVLIKKGYFPYDLAKGVGRVFKVTRCFSSRYCASGFLVNLKSPSGELLKRWDSGYFVKYQGTVLAGEE